MTEPVQTACQIVILNGIVITLGISAVCHIPVPVRIKHVNGVMYINGRNIVQY